jgi:hypothetical protein
LAAHVGQGGTVDPLGREHVHVVECRELRRRECLGGSECHVTRIVDNDIDAVMSIDDHTDA